MKKVFLLASAAFLFTGAAFAEGGKGKNKKKCAKGKSCCNKTATTAHCNMSKSSTAKM